MKQNFVKQNHLFKNKIFRHIYENLNFVFINSQRKQTQNRLRTRMIRKLKSNLKLTILYHFYKENMLAEAVQVAAATRFDCYRCSVTSKVCP